MKAVVIGTGNMGQNHVRILSEISYVDLVGIADLNYERASFLAKRFSGVAYSDYDKMLDELNPDLAVIAVPTIHHFEVAKAVIERGIHLLIEKPIAFDINQAKQIIDLAEQRRVKLMVGHVERFNPAVIHLKQMISNGVLGNILSMDARRQGPFPHRVQDIGVVIDLTVHDIDVLRFISNSNVQRVYAESRQRIHGKHEDMVHVVLSMSNQIMGSLTTNWLTPTKIRQLEVIGERGMARIDYITQDLWFYENATAIGIEWEQLQFLQGVTQGSVVQPVVNKREPLLAEQEAFIDAVSNDKPVPVTGIDGLESLRTAYAIIESSRNGNVVNI